MIEAPAPPTDPIEPAETARTPVPVRAERQGRLPGVLTASAARIRWELTSFFRNVQSLVFTVMLPVLLLVIFGSIFSGEIDGTGVDFKQYFVAGIIAAGVMSTSFTGLAINVALEREMGLIRRIGSSPMPKAAYFIGKIVLVLVTTLMETAILVGLGALLFGLQLPDDPARWLTFAWVILLGTTACSLAALAYTALIPNAASASAIVTPPFLVLQFISGVFFPFNQLPDWMQTTASLFPLKWMTQGIRSVFLPEEFQMVEPGGTWALEAVALMLGLWVAVAGVLTLMTFRWRGPRVR